MFLITIPIQMQNNDLESSVRFNQISTQEREKSFSYQMSEQIFVLMGQIELQKLQHKRDPKKNAVWS